MNELNASASLIGEARVVDLGYAAAGTDRRYPNPLPPAGPPGRCYVRLLLGREWFVETGAAPDDDCKRHVLDPA